MKHPLVGTRSPVLSHPRQLLRDAQADAVYRCTADKRTIQRRLGRRAGFCTPKARIRAERAQSLRDCEDSSDQCTAATSSG